MTHTNLTVDSTTTGIVFTFAAAGDSCLVAANVKVQSTGNYAITGDADSSNLDIEGNVADSSSSAIALFSTGNHVTIGASGSVTDTQTTDYGESTVYFGDSSSSLTNLGRITSTKSLAVYFHGDSTFQNSGTVNAATPVFVEGNGSEVINSGTLKANASFDSQADIGFNNGIYMTGTNNVATNEKHGVISAISSEGAGVLFDSGSDGSIMTNKGAISSQNWYGIDFSHMAATEAATLNNSGTITGGTGSFLGNNNGEMITNSGTMKGNVELNGGDDYFNGAKGTVTGDIDGGAGNDVILAGKGNQTITGDDGNDILDGGAGNDVLRGGNDADRFVFATGDGKDEIADYVDGTDFVDLSGWKDIRKFKTLEDHAEKHGHDLWIVDGNDTLVIDNAKLGHLDRTHFIF